MTMQATEIATYNFAYLDEQTKRMIRRAILKGIAIPGYQVPFASREMPMPYGWGTGGVQVTASIIGPDDVLKVIDQGADDTTNAVSIRAFFKKVANVAVTTETAKATIIQTRHRIPEYAAEGRPDTRLPGADSRAVALPRTARDRDAEDACAGGIRADACEALRGHRQARPHRHDLCLSGQGRGPLRDGPVADAEIRQSEDAHVAGAAAFRRRPREAHLCGAAVHRGWSASTSRIIPSRCRNSTSLARCAVLRRSISTRSSSTTTAAACSCVPIPTIARSGGKRDMSGRWQEFPPPLRGRCPQSGRRGVAPLRRPRRRHHPHPALRATLPARGREKDLRS